MNILSTSFVAFFLLFFICYWTLKDHFRLQNILVLLANYYFYSFIDWKFCALLLFTSLSVYGGSLIIERKENQNISKLTLILLVVINIGILFIFKYYNFFVFEIANLFSLNSEKLLLNLFLPVGISFYTFVSLGYAIDVYQKKVHAIKDPIIVLLFISFFPLLLSGPIERSDGLLPQFKIKRLFDYSLIADGVQQIGWGAFKKLVIADNLAVVVNNVFGNYDCLPASSLVIGAVLYTFQIYYDFSGYSDIAIGLSKMLGLKVRKNFNYPYFALNVADFWRRWHMSLQSWLMEYIYFPLGGSRCSKGRIIINTFIVFLVCGIWHGANWTFILWGFYHAVLFLPLILLFSKEFRRTTVNDTRPYPSIKELGLMMITFIFITIGWVMFNSLSVSDGIGFISGMFHSSIFNPPIHIGLNEVLYILILLPLVILFEWTQRKKEYPLQFKSPGWIKVIILYVILIHIIICNAAQSDFIYYQF